METTTIKTTQTNDRRAAINGLAIVGFITLLFIGMALAVYAARFVPAAISSVGSAAVYLSSQVFSPNGDDADLVVIPEPETVPFGEEGDTETEAETATTTPASPATGTGTVSPRPGTPTTVVVPIQVPAATNYYGLPDLVIEDIQTGYLTSSNTNTFRASNEVPDGERGAIRFTIANRGTNISDRFDFEVELPTTRSYTYKSKTQQSLRPNERIQYVLGFDSAREGNNRTITIEIDTDDDVNESNERNNTRDVSIDIED